MMKRSGMRAASAAAATVLVAACASSDGLYGDLPGGKDYQGDSPEELRLREEALRTEKQALKQRVKAVEEREKALLGGKPTPQSRKPVVVKPKTAKPRVVAQAPRVAKPATSKPQVVRRPQVVRKPQVRQKPVVAKPTTARAPAVVQRPVAKVMPKRPAASARPATRYPARPAAVRPSKPVQVAAVSADRRSAGKLIAPPPPSGDAIPFIPKPGECYARLIVPARYTIKHEKIEKMPATEKVEVIPAKFEWVEEKLLAREASQRIEVIPATYKAVDERVLVAPARLETVEYPAQFENRVERVLDSPARLVWKKGQPAAGGRKTKVDKSGDIWCLVEVPAKYKSITKKVLVRAAGHRSVEIPAKYKIVSKQVVDKPATTRKVEVPAVYKTVRVRKEVRAAQRKVTPIPPKYTFVDRRVKVAEAQTEWRKVLCSTNMTPSVIRQVQASLKKNGFNPGRLDGVLGGNTMSAVRAYQRANDLPEDRTSINVQTAERLGVKWQ